jgi:23S rRNA-/tRNA-specific pseudouridylate synthase
MRNSFHFICDREDIRLDVFLSEKLSITRTKVKEMVENGHVYVNGKIPKPSLKIKKSMKIEGEVPEEEPLSLVPEDIPLEVLYEDEYFLAINKPADMVVHPSFGHSSGTLVNAVLAYLGKQGSGIRDQGSGFRDEGSGFRDQGSGMRDQGSGMRVQETMEIANQGQARQMEHKGVGGFVVADPRLLRHDTGGQAPTPPPRHRRTSPDPGFANIRPGIVHRLDKGTTGVILVAKDSKTQEMLSHLFKERNVRKTYRAIVEGNPKREQWAVEGNIGRHPIERKKMAVLKTGGRTAETSFKALKMLRGFAYLEAYPKTGRTHQIRVHLAYSGYSIVGDETYGKKAKALAPRPLLHAYRIEFIHPIKKVSVKIEAPVPSDMEEFIKENDK